MGLAGTDLRLGSLAVNNFLKVSELVAILLCIVFSCPGCGVVVHQRSLHENRLPTLENAAHGVYLFTWIYM
jgi:hypothetical protein